MLPVAGNTAIPEPAGKLNIYRNGVFQRTAKLDGVLVDRGREVRAIFKTP
jgi:hypothetical protein